MKNPLATVLKRNTDDPQYLADQAHAAAEKAAKPELDAFTGQLVDSRARLANASKAAVKSLTDLYDAADAHDQLVRHGAAQLREHGMAYPDSTDGADDRTWQTAGGENGAILLRGSWWLPVSAAAVLVRAARGAAQARVGDRHDLSRRLSGFFGAGRLDSRPDELLKDAPLPEPRQTPVPVGRIDPEDQSIVLGKPTGHSNRRVEVIEWDLRR